MYVCMYVGVYVNVYLTDMLLYALVRGCGCVYTHHMYECGIDSMYVCMYVCM